jgi:hypothetical protein
MSYTAWLKEQQQDPSTATALAPFVAVVDKVMEYSPGLSATYKGTDSDALKLDGPASSGFAQVMEAQ